MEFYGFVHFTMNTFTGLEWGFGDEDPALFNPSAFDADQIVRAAAEAGMQGLILTTKHHDGFCLWPSAFTEHSVKRSPWKDGKGDVVREMAEACRTHGIRFGIYLSPWDRNHAAYGRPEYVTYYRNQLCELLDAYGPVFMVWLDGANGGAGYYGGARETRTIDRSTYYDWPATIALIRERAPEAMIFSDAGPDCRWVGNEEGLAGDPCWATLDLDRPDRFPGGSNEGLNSGVRSGNAWLPAECDVSIRPGWFHHPSEDVRVKSPAQLVGIYHASVGRGACLNLNLPPDRSGRLHANDLSALRGFRRFLDETFATDFAQGASAEASHTRGPADGPFAGVRAVDGDPETYWCTDDGVTCAELVRHLPSEPRFNVVSLREYLPLGQRIEAFAVDIWTDGAWVEYASGTSIGNRRLLRGAAVTAAKVRLRILAAAACPAVREFALFAEPVVLEPPTITRGWHGEVTLQATSAAARIHYTTDGTEPDEGARRYAGPFPFAAGGIVRARVSVPGAAAGSEARTAVFGVCKSGWRVVSATGSAPGLPWEPRHAIDQSPGTPWIADGALASDGKPHALVIDLGDRLELTGFSYLPALDAAPAGVIDRYELWLSADGHAWERAPVTGEFANIAANPIEQWVRFDCPRPARYVRFVALHALGDTAPAIAELGVTTH